MKFVKKHYEKILLGLVLLGLAVGTALLPYIISNKRKDLEGRSNPPLKVAPLKELDLTREEAALQRAQTQMAVDFTNGHRVFNPMRWVKKSDGTLVKIMTGNETGAGALEVVNIKTLFLKLKLNGPSASGYLITVTREGATRPSDRSPHDTYVVKGEKHDLFILKDVKGPPDKPTELVVEFNDTSEDGSIFPDKMLQRPEAYSADLKYGPEGSKTWSDQRRGAVLSFGDDKYNIVAITASNVVVSAESNKKKTTIPFNPPIARP